MLKHKQVNVFLLDNSSNDVYSFFFFFLNSSSKGEKEKEKNFTTSERKKDKKVNKNLEMPKITT